MIEVGISGVQNQRVLKRQGGDPEVMCGNRSSLHPELAKRGGVVVGRSVVRGQDVDAALHQEATEDALVVPGMTPEREPCAKLRHDHTGEVHTVGVGDDLTGLRHALAEIDVPVCVQSDVHFHIAGSTRS